MKLKTTPHKALNSFNVLQKITIVLCCFGFQFSYAQNSCSQALPITAGRTAITVIDGTNIRTSCSDANNAEWYAYTPARNYSVTLTSDLTENLCKDTRFYVYTGSCQNLVCYASDDDSGDLNCPTNNGSYLSRKTFDVFQGVTYYIAWDNKWQSLGFVFDLIEAPIVPNPCLTPTPITPGTITVNAIDGNNISTSCSSATKAKWYSYTPLVDCRLTVTSDLAVNLCKDTNFSVYRGFCNALTCVTSDDNSGELVCNSGNSNSNLSKKTFDAVGGTTYYIVWDNRWSDVGFDFQLIEQAIVVPVSYTSQTIPTINSEYNICVVDMNGDGKDDITGVSRNNLRIHYQNGSSFPYTDFPITGVSKMPSWSLAAGDYNRDGFNDLILGDYNGLSFWTSNATGTAYTSSTPGEYIFCQRTNFVDLNNDGHLDAFSCHDVDPNVYYLNNGAGGFTYYQSGNPGAYLLGITPTGGNYASLWTDFDNDGDLDLFISKCSGPACELHRNDGNGVFTDVSALAQINITPVQSWSSAVADFDNDGDMDILIGSNGSVKSMLFRNNANDSNIIQPFTNITQGSGWDTNTSINRDYIAYDFDNDGLVDVLGSGNKIMFNKGNGVFEPTNYLGGMSVGAVGDLNGDGFLDILNGSTIKYAIPNGNKWFALSLKGIESNSNGIGARVEIYGAWGKQIRDVRSGEGFEFMSTLNVHFGLGSATQIDKVIIKWPSGKVDTILNPAINQYLNVVEGSYMLGTDKVNASAFSIYPNPTSNLLTIKLSNSVSEIKDVKVFDLNGRIVLSPTVSNNSIVVKNLSAGTYLLLIETMDGKKSTEKFLKK